MDQLVDNILLSHFVHQVISPLNGVIGTLSNIIDGTIKEKSKHQQRLIAASEQLSRAIEMIRNLAYLSQLQTEEGIISLRSITKDIIMPAIIIDAIQFFQESAKKKNININLLDPHTQFIIKGHDELLKQVFINIIDNAVKYSDKSTTIKVRVWMQKHTKDYICEISNTGAVFSFAEKEKIFNLGYRGDSARDIIASGSGIGLYICKKIIETAHNGRIEAECSQDKRIITMRIRLPNCMIRGAQHASKN